MGPLAQIVKFRTLNSFQSFHGMLSGETYHICPHLFTNQHEYPVGHSTSFDKPLFGCSHEDSYTNGHTSLTWSCRGEPFYSYFLLQPPTKRSTVWSLCFSEPFGSWCYFPSFGKKLEDNDNNLNNLRENHHLQHNFGPPAAPQDAPTSWFTTLSGSASGRTMAWFLAPRLHWARFPFCPGAAAYSWILTPTKPLKQRLRWYLLIYYCMIILSKSRTLAVTFQVLRAHRCACRLHCHPRRKRLSHVPWNFHGILSHWKSATKKCARLNCFICRP